MRQGKDWQVEKKKGFRMKGYPLAWLGMSIFFYFGFDLAINDFSLRRTIIEIILMLVGLFLPWLRFLRRRG